MADANKDQKKTVKLHNGVHMPVVGFGTAFWTTVDGVSVRVPEKAWYAVNQALDIGYRHIDTAFMYGCETHVRQVLGQHFMAGKLSREDVWITSKAGHPPFTGPGFPNAKTNYVFDMEQNAYECFLNEFYQSLKNLGVGYIDLYLMHWPGGRVEANMLPVEQARKKRIEMWKALEFLYEQKLVRAIGVSNFSVDHLTHLMQNCTVKPMINQIELNPFCQQTEIVQFCNENEIKLTAYSPFGNGHKELLQNETLAFIAKNHNATVGEVILNWMVQQDIVVIPKSSNPKRIKSNLNVGGFTLLDAEMEAIRKLDQKLHFCPRPNDIN